MTRLLQDDDGLLKGFYAARFRGYAAPGSVPD